MAATAGVATPFQPYAIRQNSDAQPETRRMYEKATQTFLQGTPVQIDIAGGTGFIIAAPTPTGATNVIAGIAQEPAHNLTTSGVGTQGITYGAGTVPNQPNAILLAGGGPIIDGTIGLYVANDLTEFIGIFGDSNTAANAVLAQAMVGALFGLAKDATTHFWYVDNHVTVEADGACVEIIELVDPIGTLNGRVGFRIASEYQQLAT
jgi:hypothetical protein